MSESLQSKMSVAIKKDSTVAIVIGQQRRVSETKSTLNAPREELKSKENSNEAEQNIRHQKKLENITNSFDTTKNGQSSKKKFLINDILQQRTHQEQAIPASYNHLHLTSLFKRGKL